MPRRRFPLVDVLIGVPTTGARYGAPALLTHGTVIELFADEACTTPLDATDLDGDPITSVVVSGVTIPRFYGPNDESVLTVYGRPEGETGDGFVMSSEDPQSIADLEAAAQTAVTPALEDALVALGLKIGDAYYDQTFAPPPATDTPVVTVSTTPTIVGGVTFNAKRVADAPLGNLDIAYDPAFRYDSTPAGEAVDATFVRATTSPDAPYDLVPETITGATVSSIEYMVQSTSTTLAIRVVVNERWLTIPLDRYTVATGAPTYIRLTFPSPAARKIRLEGINYFAGATVNAGGTLFRPAAAIQRRVAVVTDSFGGGAGEPPGGADRLETFVNFLGKLLEADSLFNFGIGGTGWVHSDRPFTSRIDEALAVEPHILIFVGSGNDDHPELGITPAQITEAVRTGAGATGNVPVVYVAGPAKNNASYLSVNGPTRDGAREAGVRWVDVTDAVTASYVGSDGIHPSFEGHKRLGRVLYGRLDRFWIDSVVGARITVPVIVSLSTSPAIASEGAPLTMTATLDPYVPGQIRFRDGITLLATRTVNEGTATASYTTSSLLNGTHNLTAEFVPATLQARRTTSPVAVTVVDPPALSALPTTDLVSRFDARTLGLANGAVVPSWTPSAGARLTAMAAAAAQPTYLTAASHGKAAVRASGTQQFVANTWATAYPSGTALTFFAVMRMVTIGTGTARYLFRGTTANGGSNYSFAFNASTGKWVTFTVATATPDPQPLATDTGWQVVAGRYADGVTTLWQNSVSVKGSGTTNQSFVMSGIGLWINGGGVAGFENQVSDFALYAAGKTDTEVVQIMRYLSGVWGVPLAS